MHRKLIGGVMVVVLLLVLGGVWWAMRDARSDSPLPGDSPEISTGGPQVSRTREDVPRNVTVPDANSAVSAEVAKPEVVIDAAPGVVSQYRAFKVRIENDTFIPSTIIVHTGDIAHIDFTAVDKPYDIVQPDYGFKLTIAKSETRLLEGQYTSPGKYVFYCESCGGLDSTARGYITVVPR